MSDLISRQAAIKALADDMPQTYTPDGSHYADADIFKAQEIYADCITRLEQLPSAEPELDEWCTDCKEYDQERHCCPRWNRVIRETLKDAERKPGRWIDACDTKGGEYYRCPECGTYIEKIFFGFDYDVNFCPNCGASMERGNENG